MGSMKPVAAVSRVYGKLTNNPLNLKEKVTELENAYHFLCAIYSDTHWLDKGDDSFGSLSATDDAFFSGTMQAMKHWRRVFATPSGYISVGL